MLFCRTMHGVMSEPIIFHPALSRFLEATASHSLTRCSSLAMTLAENIQHLCERNRSKTWGADGWKKGRYPAQPRDSAFLEPRLR